MKYALMVAGLFGILLLYGFLVSHGQVEVIAVSLVALYALVGWAMEGIFENKRL